MSEPRKVEDIERLLSISEGAYASLEVEIAIMTEERDAYMSGMKDEMANVDAAEARIAELVEALIDARECLDFKNPKMHTRTSLMARIDAALADAKEVTHD